MKKSDYLKVHLRAAPHIHSGRDVEGIMRRVFWALLPVILFAVAKYGLSALGLLVVCILGALGTEYWIEKRRDPEATFRGDGSALLTGLLLALTLPAGLPFWMALVGAVVAILLGKQAFGGLGQNPFNPALVGRVFLQAAFPQAMTSWHPAWADGRFSGFFGSSLTFPLLRPEYDALSGATPLGLIKFEGIPTDLISLILDQTTGSIGEGSPILLLLGGLYLAFKRDLDWRIPAGIFASVFLVSSTVHHFNPAGSPGPLFMLVSGGLVLGAVYMTTDMVTSPLTPKGIWVYGLFIGALVATIRLWGGMPEGMAFTILIANGLVPLLNRAFPLRVYGYEGGGQDG